MHLFQHPTIAELARVVQNRVLVLPCCSDAAVGSPWEWGTGWGTGWGQNGQQNGIEESYPLSPMQHGILFHSLHERDAAMYVVQWTATLQGDLDCVAFQRAWQSVLDRHPVLRTSFIWEGSDEPRQVVHPVHPHLVVPWNDEDWRGFGPDEQHERMRRFLQEDQVRGFHPSHPPLMRLNLFRVADDTFSLVWTLHHAILDGWSVGLLLREVFAAYQVFSQHQAFHRQPCRPYRDFIFWLQQQDLSQARAFWQRRLGGFTAPTPLIHATPDEPGSGTARYVEQHHPLPIALATALRDFARTNQLTPGTVFEGVWALLLSRYSGESDVVFGETVSGRTIDLAGVEEMIGPCINTLPVRVQVSPEVPLRSWLKDLQHQQVEARQYEQAPLVLIQQWSDLKPGVPLFRSLLNVENYPGGTRSFETGVENLRLTSSHAVERTNYPLNLSVREGDTLELRIIYDTHVFDAETIRRLAGHVQVLLTGMVQQPQRTVGSLPLLTTEEWQALVRTASEQRGPYPDQCVHHLFDAQAAHTPHATAVTFRNEHLSYQALADRANRLAHVLQQYGVSPDRPVAVCLERCPDLPVALLAILKAGGAYLPLDPAAPAARLAAILEEACPVLLLTHTPLAGLLTEATSGVPLCCLDTPELEEMLAAMPATPPDSPVNPGHLAYIIYTSGSTGRPKGVLVPHRGLSNLAQVLRQTFGAGVGDRVLQFSSPTFDASLWDMSLALFSGATLCLASREEIMPGPPLLHTLHHLGITIASFPPSVLACLPDTPLPALHTLILGGEACPADLVARWAPGRRLFNVYGPTECSICATIAACANDGQRPPIGSPIANTEAYVLDAQGQPVPIGVVGELYLGGVGVARGYLEQPVLTQERFVAHPFRSEPEARLYRTGDLVRLRADGQLEFVGRRDEQVKVHGVRIEPGEIERVLRQHPLVQDTVVVARVLDWEAAPEQASLSLVAYLVPHGSLPDPNELRRFLQQQLPSPMIPTVFVEMEQLPLTSSGKVDRRALPAPPPRRAGMNGTNGTNGMNGTNGTNGTPETTLQQAIAAVWRRVLHLEQVNLHDNFFDLGGHSLHLGQVYSDVRAMTGKTITIVDLFHYPTIASLSRFLGQGNGDETLEPGRPAVPVTEGYGTNGSNGTNGMSKTNEANGTNGSNGTNGANGANGSNGTNSPDNAKGKERLRRQLKQHQR
ncbi:MAG: amino acid adenylation domain-containing protein, partial [Chloroflexaceae bacterium]|nr:amino acid adenylation domain-containing protein [Chloroflexaceae bacterium]